MAMVVMGMPERAMGMQRKLVSVQVDVMLLKHQQHPSDHQRGRQQQSRSQGLPQHHQRKQSSHEWRGGEQHRLADGPQIAQGQQIQPDREAVAQGNDGRGWYGAGWAGSLRVSAVQQASKAPKTAKASPHL